MGGEEMWCMSFSAVCYLHSLLDYPTFIVLPYDIIVFFCNRSGAHAQRAAGLGKVCLLYAIDCVHIAFGCLWGHNIGDEVCDEPWLSVPSAN